MKKYTSEPLITTMIATLVCGSIAGIFIFYSHQAAKMAPVLALLVIALSLSAGLVHRHFKDKKEPKI